MSSECEKSIVHIVNTMQRVKTASNFTMISEHKKKEQHLSSHCKYKDSDENKLICHVKRKCHEYV